MENYDTCSHIFDQLRLLSLDTHQTVGLNSRRAALLHKNRNFPSLSKYISILYL